MKRLLTLIIGVTVIALGILATTVLFTVHQTQQVIVLQFGDPREVITEAGLNWKLPWQSLEFYGRLVVESIRAESAPSH